MSRNQISEQRVQELVKQELRSVRREIKTFSGPIPPPDQLEEYERIQPGFAQELLEMAKTNQAHLQAIEKGAQETQRNFLEKHQVLFARGQIWGGIISLIVLGCGTYIATAGGSPEFGASIIAAVMLALGGAFAWGKWVEGNSLKEK